MHGTPGEPSKCAVMPIDAPAFSAAWLRRRSHQPPIWIKVDVDELAPAPGRGCGPGESSAFRHVHVDGCLRPATGGVVKDEAAPQLWQEWLTRNK